MYHHNSYVWKNLRFTTKGVNSIKNELKGIVYKYFINFQFFDKKQFNFKLFWCIFHFLMHIAFSGCVLNVLDPYRFIHKLYRI